MSPNLISSDLPTPYFATNTQSRVVVVVVVVVPPTPPSLPTPGVSLAWRHARSLFPWHRPRLRLAGGAGGEERPLANEAVLALTGCSGSAWWLVEPWPNSCTTGTRGTHISLSVAQET